MRPDAKPAKAKVEAELAALRKSLKNEASRRRQLEKRPAEAETEQTVTGEILRVTSSSPTDQQPVFEAILERVRHLCGVTLSVVFLARQSRATRRRGARSWTTPWSTSRTRGSIPPTRARCVIACLTIRPVPCPSFETAAPRCAHRLACGERSSSRCSTLSSRTRRGSARPPRENIPRFDRDVFRVAPPRSLESSISARSFALDVDRSWGELAWSTGRSKSLMSWPIAGTEGRRIGGAGVAIAATGGPSSGTRR
jgi:hypothetical protein